MRISAPRIGSQKAETFSGGVGDSQSPHIQSDLTHVRQIGGKNAATSGILTYRKPIDKVRRALSMAIKGLSQIKLGQPFLHCIAIRAGGQYLFDRNIVKTPPHTHQTQMRPKWDANKTAFGTA